MSMMLEQAGAKVTAVGSVKEALEALESLQPDALVSDIGLPDEDGYALIRRLRSREAERGGFLPAVAMTGFVRTEDRARILAAGFQVHVPKPVDAVGIDGRDRCRDARPTGARIAANSCALVGPCGSVVIASPKVRAVSRWGLDLLHGFGGEGGIRTPGTGFGLLGGAGGTYARRHAGGYAARAGAVKDGFGSLPLRRHAPALAVLGDTQALAQGRRFFRFGGAEPPWRITL